MRHVVLVASMLWLVFGVFVGIGGFDIPPHVARPPYWSCSTSRSSTAMASAFIERCLPPVPGATRIGLISDTHGLLRPEALACLAGSDHIVHAGDIGGAEILPALEHIAPVTAVRGNNDDGTWATALPEAAVLRVGRISICVVHDLRDLDPAVAASMDAVVAGHSHRPSVTTRNGVLHVNPGSAGPRRFRLPVCAGRLTIADGKVSAQLVTLLPVPDAAKRSSPRRV